MGASCLLVYGLVRRRVSSQGHDMNDSKFEGSQGQSNGGHRTLYGFASGPQVKSLKRSMSSGPLPVVLTETHINTRILHVGSESQQQDNLEILSVESLSLASGTPKGPDCI